MKDRIDTRNEYLVTADNGKHFIWAYNKQHAQKIALASRGAREVQEVKIWTQYQESSAS